MTGTVCSVANCKSNAIKSKKCGEKIKFFTFPKDPVLKEEWVRLCKRNDNFDATYKRICSRHFKTEDFENSLKIKLMGSEPRKLKSNALPSLYLPDKTPDTPRKRFKSLKMKEKEIKENKTTESNNTLEDIIILHVIPENETLSSPIEEISDHVTLQRNYKDILKECDQLKDQIVELTNTQMDLELKNQALLKALLESQKTFESELKRKFAHFLTHNQIDIALKKKTKIRWNEGELFTAFTLSEMSTKTYLHLRDELHYPLPGLSTIQHWACRNEMLHK